VCRILRVDRQEKKAGHEPIACFAACPSASISACFVFFVTLVSCIKMVELGRATTGQPIQDAAQRLRRALGRQQEGLIEC